jgi:hypothetical protein
MSPDNHLGLPMAFHIPLIVQGVPVGDLITAGDQLVFFTVKKALAALDGLTFGSTAEVVAAVTELISGLESSATPAAA